MKPIYANIHHLLNDLSQDVQFYLHNEKKNLDVFWSKCQFGDHSTDQSKSPWKNLIDFWLYLPYPANSKEYFVETLRIYYRKHEQNIKILDEFERDYNGENAVEWYTRETFIYNVLNRALRQHSLQIIFLFGFFLQDIHRQLQREYKRMQSDWADLQLTLYRGQFMSKSELRAQTHPLSLPLFSQNGTKIINNSLFSTTMDRSQALIRTDPNIDPTDINSNQNILFEINVTMGRDDEDLCHRRPFGAISHLSQFNGEEEILFMIGTSFYFDPKAIHYDEKDRVWIFKLELDNYNFEIYENEFDSICKRKNLKRCITLLTQNNRERCMSMPPSTLETIFRELDEMYPTEMMWISAMKSHCLALYQQFQKEDYSKALMHYEEALKLWSSFMNDDELNYFLDLGEIHYQIGYCFHFELNNHNKAKSHYDQSIHFYELSISEKFSTSNYERIQVYKALALVYERRKRLKHNVTVDYLRQVKCNELYFENIFRFYPPKYTINAWSTLELIADTYEYIGQIDLAISYYETVVALREGLMFLEDYPKIIYTFENIGSLQRIFRRLIKLYMNNKQNYNLALTYQTRLYEYELQGAREYGNDDVEKETQLLAYHHSTLADIYKGLKQYQLAYEHSQTALNKFKRMDQSISTDLSIKAEEKKIDSLIPLLSSQI